MTHPRSHEAGFTLVELMTALTITVVVTVYVLGVMTTQERSYYAQKHALESQIDARLIADMVMRDVRAAGFLVPAIVGISSRDGGTANSDVLCTSDPAAISENTVTGATDRLNGAPLIVSLDTSDIVEVDDGEKDIDGDGNDDFVVGSGIIVSDGTTTHCARVVALGADEIQFAPATLGGFSAAVPLARAMPAVIYEITGGALRRNTLPLSTGVEDFQVEFGVDTTGNGILDKSDANEFPINDLNVSGSNGVELVQLSVLTRSAVADPELNTPGRPSAANRLASGISDSFRRRRITVGVSPRNL